MNYYKIKPLDIANGLYCRTSIFFSGCKGFNGKHCEGCFNSELWNFKSGKKFDENAKKELFECLSKSYIDGRLSILGGEPLQQDLDELKSLIIEVKEKFPQGDIWLWTGYYLSELDEKQKEIISLCNYVVDGRFDITKSGKNIKFRGSTNQTIWENKDNKFIKSKLND